MKMWEFAEYLEIKYNMFEEISRTLAAACSEKPWYTYLGDDIPQTEFINDTPENLRRAYYSILIMVSTM